MLVENHPIGWILNDCFYQIDCLGGVFFTCFFIFTPILWEMIQFGKHVFLMVDSTINCYHTPGKNKMTMEKPTFEDGDFPASHVCWKQRYKKKVSQAFKLIEWLFLRSSRVFMCHHHIFHFVKFLSGEQLFWATGHIVDVSSFYITSMAP